MRRVLVAATPGLRQRCLQQLLAAGARPANATESAATPQWRLAVPQLGACRCFSDADAQVIPAYFGPKHCCTSRRACRGGRTHIVAWAGKRVQRILQSCRRPLHCRRQLQQQPPTALSQRPISHRLPPPQPSRETLRHQYQSTPRAPRTPRTPLQRPRALPAATQPQIGLLHADIQSRSCTDSARKRTASSSR